MDVKFDDLQKTIKESRDFFHQLERKQFFPRSGYLAPLAANLEDPKVEILCGIRRAGKSTLLFQLSESLLKKGVPEANILYFKLDSFDLRGYDAGVLRKLLAAHKLEFSPSGRIYCLLDEIQALKGWETWCKDVFDEQNDLKLFLTGSSSQITKSASGAALTGRNIFHRIFPLSFREFLSIKTDFTFSGEEVALFEKSFPREIIRQCFQEYLQWGGFPELLSIADEEKKRQTLQGYFRDIISRDVLAAEKTVRNPAKLEQLALYLIRNHGNLFSANSLAKSYGISVDTVQDYFRRLADCALFFPLRRFSYSEKEAAASIPKIYCIDHGLARAMRADFKPNEGKAYENIAFLEFYRRDGEISYFEGDPKGELDFVWETDGDIFAMEVDSSDSLDPDKSAKVKKILANFEKKTEAARKRTRLLFITGNEFRRGKDYEALPLWMALLSEDPFAGKRLNLATVAKASERGLPSASSPGKAGTNKEETVFLLQNIMSQKPIPGIIALVDIVDFTKQVVDLGDAKGAKFIKFFSSEARKIITSHGFETVKELGDAILFFGNGFEKFLDIFLDFFTLSVIPGRFDFKADIRMTAHFGVFTFFPGYDGKPDVIGSNAIRNFRQEKMSMPWECLVTDGLFRGIQLFLDEKHIEILREQWDEPLKGFELFGNTHVTYRLIPPRENEEGGLGGSAYRKKREELKQQTRKIPVFINLYKEIDMEENFINLSLQKEWRGAGKRGGFRIGRDYEKKMELAREGEFRDEGRKDILNAADLYEAFNKGVILGLPGAGKTTVMRHFAFTCFRRMESPGILFVNCRDLPPEGMDPARIEGDLPYLIRLLLLAFLYPKKMERELAPLEVRELDAAYGEISAAWREKRAVILLDALDEAPTEEARRMIWNVAQALMKRCSNPEREDPEELENRVFLASRPAYFPGVANLEEPVFYVNPIDIGDMQKMALALYGDDASVCAKFLDGVADSPWIKKLAGTPLTAMLLLVYYETMGTFGLRYACYDLILKFILNRTWMLMKTGELRKSVPEYLRESSDKEFLEKRPEILDQYNALSDLAYQCLFQLVDGASRRSLKEEELLSILSDSMNNKEKREGAEDGREKAREWAQLFIKEHLLVPAGNGEYLFIHSTIMEFLAGRMLGENLTADKRIVKRMLREMTEDKGKRELESLPILCGKSYEAGFQIMGLLKEFCAEEKPLGLPFRCLAEIEAAEKNAIETYITKRQREAEEKRIEKGLKSKEWAYQSLRELFDTGGATETAEKEKIGSLSKLRRKTFLEKRLFEGKKKFELGYVTQSQWAFLDAIVEKNILEDYKLKEIEKNLAYSWNILGKEDSLLTLDSVGYDPEDKNFAYYRNKTLGGGGLKGIFGSPNMKHEKAVTSCAFSPDGKEILSASDDHTLRLWDRETGKEKRIFKGHTDYVTSCAFSPDGKEILSASRDKTLRLWDRETGKELRIFKGHTLFLDSCAFSRDGKEILSASWDKTLRLWDRETGKEIRIFKGHTNRVSSCAFSPDGKEILSASKDNTLRLWDKQTGKEIRIFKGHTNSESSCAFSPDGKEILSTSSDDTLCLWDRETGKEIKIFKGHSGSVTSCAFNRDGKEILSASWDKTLRLWNRETGKEIKIFRGHSGSVTSCAFSPDGKEILSLNVTGKAIHLWDRETGKEIKIFRGHSGSVTSCAFNPDGKEILSASWDKTLRLWDYTTGQEGRIFKGHTDSVSSCAFSPDGKEILSASYNDNTLHLWNRETGKEIRIFKGHSTSVTSCAFSPDGREILSSSWDSTLRLWERETGKEIRIFKGHTNTLTFCAFSPDGKEILSSSADYTIRLWERETGKEIRIFKGHTAIVTFCVFNPIKKEILSASNDSTLRLWDRETGNEIRTFNGHSKGVYSCAFSPGGKEILSASEDNTLRLWDRETGREVSGVSLPWTPHFAIFCPGEPNLALSANSNGVLSIVALRPE